MAATLAKLVPVAFCLIFLIPFFWSSLKKRDRSIVVKKIEYNDLPGNLRREIEQVEDIYACLGFSLQSNFKVTHRGEIAFSAVFLSSDRSTLAEIRRTRHVSGLDERWVDIFMTSVLDDGTFLQSNHYDLLPTKYVELEPKPNHLRLKAAGTSAPTEMLHLHRELVAESIGAESIGAARVLPITDELVSRIQEYNVKCIKPYMCGGTDLPGSLLEENARTDAGIDRERADAKTLDEAALVDVS